MKFKLEKLRSLLVFLLLTGAAAGIATSSMNLLRDPSISRVMRQDSFSEPDDLNMQLNKAKGQLAMLDSHVAPDVAFRFVGPEESFDYYQAVMAPHRLGVEIDSSYIFFCSESREWLSTQPALQDSTLVALLFHYGGIARKEAR